MPGLPESPENIGTDSEGLVIFKYSRAQAIADGVLIDVTPLAREAGYRHPAAMISAAYHDSVAVAPMDDIHDEAGRLWDVLNVLRFTVLNAPQVSFYVHVADEAGNVRKVRLKAVFGTGDQFEPVITIMLLDED